MKVPPVFRVGPDRAEEASEALTQAFLSESATDFFFPPPEGGKLEKLRALFGWAVEYRMQSGLPVLGIAEPGHPVSGAATLSVPGAPAATEVMERLWPDVEKIIGPAASERLDRYETCQKRHAVAAPHHYLVAIGVHPDFQGLGYGGALLREAIRMVDEDPASAGIGLDTASDANQALYEKFGFKVIGTEQLDDKLARFMFRASP